MEVRFNTINEDVEEVLEFIDKHSRKYFIETAVLYYLKHLKENKNIIDVCLDIDKFENRKTKTEKKSATQKATTKKIVTNLSEIVPVKEEVKVETPSPIPSYSSFEDMADEGW